MNAEASVGTFEVKDAFYITGRGLVLLGRVSGQVAPGYKLVFEDATLWIIKGVELINLYDNKYEKTGLLIDVPFITHEELLQRGIMWNIARICTP
jgi:hypothetical protein